METVVEEKQVYTCFEDYLKDIYPKSLEGNSFKADDPVKIGVNMANESLLIIKEMLLK